MHTASTQALIVLLACLASALGAPPDAGETQLTQKLNAQIVGSGYPKVYEGGGLGVIVRNPFDGFENDVAKQVVPSTFLHNDIFVGNKVFPSFSKDGMDFTTPTMAYVIGSRLDSIFYDLAHIQDPNWGWGVFYPWDSNSADSRCRWRADGNYYDCPGYSIPWGQQSFPWPANKGAGGYPAGNPQANPSWGGGAGCHFSSPPYGCHSPAPCTYNIDQVNRQPINLVQDRDCQCNYKFNDNWIHWVQSLGSVEPNLLPEAAMCWVNNLRDLIRLQNALWWYRALWFTSEGQKTGPTGYWGWNEIPVTRTAVTNPSNWDAVMIKMPIFICTLGKRDFLKCLSRGAGIRLENTLDQWVAAGKLVPGIANVGKKPGSSLVLAREYKDASKNFLLEFFCEAWTSPTGKYAIQFRATAGGDPGQCFLDKLKQDEASQVLEDRIEFSLNTTISI